SIPQPACSASPSSEASTQKSYKSLQIEAVKNGAITGAKFGTAAAFIVIFSVGPGMTIPLACIFIGAAIGGVIGYYSMSEDDIPSSIIY
ncbi:MAG: hypothetical protein K6E38_05875, partial [Fretibacterium sp.]|nr:hypothetical protein [Fretibacterium sp.]